MYATQVPKYKFNDSKFLILKTKKEKKKRKRIQDSSVEVSVISEFKKGCGASWSRMAQ